MCVCPSVVLRCGCVLVGGVMMCVPFGGVNMCVSVGGVYVCVCRVVVLRSLCAGLWC